MCDTPVAESRGVALMFEAAFLMVLPLFQVAAAVKSRREGWCASETDTVFTHEVFEPLPINGKSGGLRPTAHMQINGPLMNLDTAMRS